MAPCKSERGRIRTFIPETIFFAVIWPHLFYDGYEPQYRSTYFRWHKDRIRKFVVKKILINRENLTKIFPKTEDDDIDLTGPFPWEDLGEYNYDLTVGPLKGGVMGIFASQDLPIILKYDIIGQLLEIEFTYKTMRFEWNNEKQRVSLSPLQPFTTNKCKTTEELKMKILKNITSTLKSL